MGKVYVVEELFYDEKTTKEVRAVFKNRKKAEEYCSCHIDCSIKECNYSDDKTYTPFNRVLIQGKINGQSFPSYTFQRLSKEDDDSESKEFVYVFQSFGDTNVKFVVNKILTDNYDEETEKSIDPHYCSGNLISYFAFCSAGRDVAGIAVPDPLRGDRI